MLEQQKSLALETKRVLGILRALGNEDQRIAFAVLEGMRLQQMFDSQYRPEKNQRDRPA